MRSRCAIILVGVSFGGGTGGGVWLLVSTASAALYVHYSVYVLEPSTLWRRHAVQSAMCNVRNVKCNV
jgi:hypothetical protein